MEELSTIKQELKCWEHMFQRKHGRKPNKEDVSNGPEEIKETYQRYRELKQTASQNQKENKDEDSGVFGKDLNKKPKPQVSLSESVRIRDWTGVKPVRLCHGQRPRIRVNHDSGDAKTASSSEQTKEISAPADIVREDMETNEEATNNKEFSITSIKMTLTSRPQSASTFRTPQLKKRGDTASRIKRRASIATTWLDKCKPDLSEPLINVEGESRVEGAVSPVKRVVGETSRHYTPAGNDIRDVSTENTSHTAMPSGLSGEESNHFTSLNCLPNGGVKSIYLIRNLRPDEVKEQGITVKDQDNSNITKSYTISTSEDLKEAEHLFLSSSHGSQHSSRNIHGDKTRSDNLHDATQGTGNNSDVQNEQQFMSDLELAELSDMEWEKEMCDANKIDNSELRNIVNNESVSHDKSPERIIPESANDSAKDESRLWESIVAPSLIKQEKSLPETSTKVKERRKRTRTDLDEVENEFHPNKKLRTAKEESRTHADLLEEEDNQEEDDHDSTQQGEERGEVQEDGDGTARGSTSKAKGSGTTKRSAPGSGLVSENFKRLNMKVKTYRRRGGGISGSAYKRRVWRQTEKARGGFVQTSGWCRPNKGPGTKSGSCFKCGQEGHWAKNCRGQGKATSQTPWANKQLDSDGEDETLEQFPTFEEAACMAAGIPVSKETTSETQLDGSAFEMGPEFVLPHQLPRPAHVPTAAPPPVEPLYQPQHGKPIETPDEVLDTLKGFGFSSFRPGQEQAVMRILCGLSSLIVLSTGAGKSLCYQLPAYLYAKRSPCVTLVISPLVSLMEDQIMGLPLGLKGACLHTNLTKVQREKILADLCSGKVAVLLLSPEALVGGGSGFGCLPSRVRLPPIAFACIDESHCLSEWSHNFRPSYLRVCKVLRERFGVQCFLGLTATATVATAGSVAKHLGIPIDDNAIIRGAAIPNNLYLSVSCDRDRDTALIELLKGPRFSKCESIIIYCTRRQQTERVSSMLRTCLQDFEAPQGALVTEEPPDMPNKKGKKTKRKKKKAATSAPPKWDAESYHAGMTAAQRRRVQKRFMAGELRIVVATVAFGMGLDKSDVRAIIHYNMPKSFESYVQEIGRAGRDGLPSQCHVFLQPEGKDMYELRRHIFGNTVDRITIKKLVNRVFLRCECRVHHQHQLRREGRESTCEGEVSVRGCHGNELSDIEDDKVSLGDIQSSDALVRPSEGGKVADCEEFQEGTRRNDIKITSPTNDQDEKLQTNSGAASRVCGGHEVALPIERLVQDLDMPEENIATLLCYLELHDNRWLEVLQLIKSTCTIKCYGGYPQLRTLANKIPPIAAAFAYNEEHSVNKLKKTNSVTFPVVKIADKMGWDLDPVCKELRSLQWNSSLAPNQAMASSGQSGILVEFDDMSFHVRAPGDLTDEERDSVCDFLEDRIVAEERTELTQLHTLYSLLKSVSCSEYWMCSEEADKISDEQLKQIIQKYFSDTNDATQKELENLTTARVTGSAVLPVDFRDSHADFGYVARDIRALTSIHHDHSFTGRAVARIFHGIDSPCYPAQVWGRDRRFWRKHLEIDFNCLRKFATRELLNLR